MPQRRMIATGSPSRRGARMSAYLSNAPSGHGKPTVGGARAKWLLYGVVLLVPGGLVLFALLWLVLRTRRPRGGACRAMARSVRDRRGQARGAHGCV